MWHSIRNKVLLAVLSVTTFIACSMALVFYLKSADMIQKNYEENLYQRIKQIVQGMDSDLKDIYYMNIKAAENTSLLELIEEYAEKEDREVLNKIAEELRSYQETGNGATSVYFIFKEQGVAVTSEDYPMIKKGISQDYLAMLEEIRKNQPVPVVLPDIVHEKENQLSCIRAVYGSEGDILGYIMSNIEERTFFYKYLQPLCDEKMVQGVILDNQKRIITSEEYGDAGKEFQKKEKNQKKDEIVISVKGAFSGTEIYLTALKSKILEGFTEMREFLVIMFLLFIFFAGILALWVTKTLCKPIEEMRNTVEKVGKGDLSLRVKVNTKDEVGILCSEFNTMLDKTEELIGQVIQEERAKKDAELEALQYQITPHFMYNTLNSIKYAALLKGEQEIAGLLEDFIELLQASINKKGTFIAVTDELHILENYIQLQEFRYRNNFTVEYQVEKEAYSCIVPRLLLQPLVENAIFHGIDIKNGKGKITIRGRIEGDILFLEVSDNGRGMSKEKIQELFSEKQKKTHGLSAIGVVNVKERLELYYGENGGIFYESSEEGTTATVFLPVQRE